MSRANRCSEFGGFIRAGIADYEGSLPWVPRKLGQAQPIPLGRAAGIPHSAGKRLDTIVKNDREPGTS